MDDEKDEPVDLKKLREASNKAFDTLLRRNRISKDNCDTMKGMVSYAFNVLDTHPSCGGTAFIGAKVMQNLIEISGLLSAFEDHIEECEADKERASAFGADTDKKEETSSPVIEKKDNVIHVDLSKGRKN